MWFICHSEVVVVFIFVVTPQPHHRLCQNAGKGNYLNYWTLHSQICCNASGINTARVATKHISLAANYIKNSSFITLKGLREALSAVDSLLSIHLPIVFFIYFYSFNMNEEWMWKNQRGTDINFRSSCDLDMRDESAVWWRFLSLWGHSLYSHIKARHSKSYGVIINNL